MNVDEEVLRLARLLESVVRVSKVSVRELERRLDLGGGSLNRIFSGRIELKVRHILLVLDALGLDPKPFFKTAYDERPDEEPPRPFVDDLIQALQVFAPAGRRLERAAQPLSDDELDSRILEAFRRLGIEKPKGEGPEPSPPAQSGLPSRKSRGKSRPHPAAKTGRPGRSSGRGNGG